VQKRFSVALGFLFLIAAGALFLASPVARNANVWGDVTTSLFTAFSSVCVTGLTVVDIAAEYSRAGQIAILILVEIGCLGLMTCGTFILIAVGRRLSIGREFYLMNAYGVAEVKGIKGLICWVVGAMLTIEIIGAFLYWLLLDDAYLACFYSIMSFCNAGFCNLQSCTQCKRQVWKFACMWSWSCDRRANTAQCCCSYGVNPTNRVATAIHFKWWHFGCCFYGGDWRGAECGEAEQEK
jgi:hypothetical protein